MAATKRIKPKILVVDDDQKIRFAFREVLKKDGYTTVLARDGVEALEQVEAENVGVVFMDISMPRLDGLETLKRLRERNKSVPTIIITGYGTMQTAIKAMQLGAFDYLTKPLDVEKVRELTRKALSSAGEPDDGPNEHSLLTVDVVDRYELVGNSPGMQEVYKLIGLVSTTPATAPVLIDGESGTGKELVARAIHASGSGTGEPFVGINCAALPETLLESELFGYEKGAFTGAAERKLGKFEIARGGTIFLDEIASLSMNLQQKLLRVLQEREFERLGGDTAIRVNARFVAAANIQIENEIRKGNFRDDLFFRLNVIRIHLPPLRERTDDIPLLANYFLAKYNEQLNKDVKGFSREAMALLRAYQYPGNVRELENLIERALMLARGEQITPDMIQRMFDSPSGKGSFLPVKNSTFKQSRGMVLQMFEKQFVEEKLAHHGGNVTAAAKSSGMTRQNFQRMMKKYDVRAEDFRGDDPAQS